MFLGWVWILSIEMSTIDMFSRKRILLQKTLSTLLTPVFWPLFSCRLCSPKITSVFFKNKIINRKSCSDSCSWLLPAAGQWKINEQLVAACQWRSHGKFKTWSWGSWRFLVDKQTSKLAMKHHAGSIHCIRDFRIFRIFNKFIDLDAQSSKKKLHIGMILLTVLSKAGFLLRWMTRCRLDGDVSVAKVAEIGGWLAPAHCYWQMYC